MKPIIFTSFMVAFMCFPFLCGMAQPINSIESQEGLNSLIGKYISSTHYNGSATNWTELNRRSVFYDDRENMIEFVQENYNSGTWDKGLKYSFEYDFDNNLLSSKSYYWLGEEWTINSADIYNYDIDNRLSGIVYTKKRSGVITNDRRILFEYDKNGDLEKQTEQIWDFSDWANTYRTMMDYNSQGQLVLVQREIWSDGDWSPKSKSEYTYDIVNRLCERIEFSYEDNSWINSIMVNCTYDKWGRMTETINSFWSGAEWVPDYKALYAYHKEDIVKSIKVMKWSLETLKYSDYSLTEKTFDLLDRELTKLVKFNGFGQLENYSQSRYSYNTSGLSEYEKQTWKDDKWNNDVKLEYDFSILSVDEDMPSTNSLSAYPNPFDENSTISFTLDQEATVKLNVFDSKGKPVCDLEDNIINSGTHTYIFAGDNLASGVYYYHLQIDGRTEVKPIIKMN